MIEQAITKLKDGLDGEKFSLYGNVVAESVVNTLITLCRQNEEFAQAIVQSDKTVKECIEGTVEGAGRSLSDFVVYSRAVSFWFPGAELHCTMTLDLGDGGFSNNAPAAAAEEPQSKKLDLSLDDLLG